MILVRWQDAVYAFALSCPHQNTALNGMIASTRSSARSTIPNSPHGDYIADSGRATRNMDRLAIRRDGASIVIDVDKLFQEDTDGPQWAAAVVKLS